MVGMVAGSLMLHKPSLEPWPALLRVPVVLALPVGLKEASLDDTETSSIPHSPHCSSTPGQPSLILFLPCAVQLCKMFLEETSECVICAPHFGLSFAISSLSLPQQTEVR